MSGDIHFGTFKDAANDIYFMVVNKQCHPNAGQQFVLELELEPNHSFIIREILQESSFLINTNAAGKSSFNISIGPGKGLFYKVLQN